MAFRVDLHSHTGHSSDSLLPAADLLAQAARRGLAAIAVTDHNSLGGALQALALMERSGDRHAELRVIPGEEVMTSEGEIIGLFLSEPIPRGLSPEATIQRIRDQGGLVIVPHPFDRLRHSRLRAEAIDRVAHLVDAMETLNARTTFAADNERAQRYAMERGLAASAGSDSHTAGEAGRAYVELDEPPASTSDGLLAQLRRGRVCGSLSPPIVHVGSKLAAWRKKLGLAPAVQL